jgi:hypothetical protein
MQFYGFFGKFPSPFYKEFGCSSLFQADDAHKKSAKVLTRRQDAGIIVLIT